MSSRGALAPGLVDGGTFRYGPSCVQLSVVIPAHNEAQRLPPTLRQIQSVSASEGLQTEIIVADDGSSDGTATVARDLGAQVVSLEGHPGPGVAVREGVLRATGDRILMCDADGPVPLADLWPLWRELDRGTDIAVGSRALNPATVEVRQPPHRIVMGRVWSRLVRRIARVPVRDTQCGFKLFTRQAAHMVFEPLRSRGFAFHVEALSLAHGAGLTVVEIPVRWSDRPGSRIRLLQDPANMFVELLGVAWRQRRMTP